MPRAPLKSFLAVGPTLHYSHAHVQKYWLFSAAIFCASCLFWSRIVSGTFWAFDFEATASADFWRLGKSFVTGLSIFEYPWQIVVLGMLMGIFAIAPILASQLLSFQHSLIFILAVFFLAYLPGFAISLLIGCFAVACRPLRFRSRIIAVALCTAPQVIYWGCFGAARGVEPLEWGFSFAPWVFAWLYGLCVAGLVQWVGHITRYKPGLIFASISLTLVGAAAVFESKVGFDELDYQLYVAKNDPEQVGEFRDNSLTEALDRTIKDPAVGKYLAGFFYPADPIPLRQELKREIQSQLSYDRWPSWLMVPEELKYQDKRRWLNEQYDRFINPRKAWWMPIFVYEEWSRRRSVNKRMPIALYYKALLGEYSPDLRVVGEQEVLRFYSDWPYDRSGEVWFRLYRDFGASAESLEARWRIARHLAARGYFGQAEALLAEAQAGVKKRLEVLEKKKTAEEALFGAFRRPPDSVMTVVKLTELHRRVNELQVLLGSENRADNGSSAKRLASFISLNPHNLEYSRQLEVLLASASEKDRLRDNILLAQAKLIADETARAEKLTQLQREFANTDGGMQASYELTRLKIKRYQDETNLEQKKKYLADARSTLASFVSLYPNSFYAEQVKKNLEDLPKVE